MINEIVFVLQIKPKPLEYKGTVYVISVIYGTSLFPQVKFVSPRKSKGDDEDDDEEDEETIQLPEKSQISSAFEIECCKFVKAEMSVSFAEMKSCSDRSRVVLVGHLTRVVEEFESSNVFKHLLNLSQLEWSEFYLLELAQWLRDENIPLDYSLRMVFTLLNYAENEEDVQIVYADLSGVSELDLE